MKKIMIVIAVFVMFTGTAYAQFSGGGAQPMNPEGECRDREALSSMTSSTGFTGSKVVSSTYGNAVAVLFQVKTAAVNFTMDSTAPTATAGTDVGFTLNAGDSFIIYGHGNITRARFINAVASNGAKVEVCFYY